MAPALLVVSAAASRVLAQNVVVTGAVREAATNTPLIGVVLTLGTGEAARTTRSGDRGTFAFANVATGSYTLVARRLGYDPVRQTVNVTADSHSVDVAMQRVTSIDTVRVRASQQAIYGAVGTSTDLRPLPDAKVQVFGSSVGKATLDSTGHFFYPVKDAGAYMVTATLDGYEPQSVSITVPSHEGVDVALLLDSARGPASHILAAGYDDLRTRLLERGLNAVLIPRSDLLAHDASEMLTAIRMSKEFNKKGVRMGPTACVFVDGNPKPGLPIDAFDPRDAESIEMYAARDEHSLTLARRWPHGVPCTETGVSSETMPGRDVIYWIVIWTKR